MSLLLSHPKLQPLDQGIIENIKVYYWKQVLSNVLSRINSNKGSPPTVSAITASVNVLDCCYWIASAITPTTVTRCFIHAGFPQSPSIALPPQIVTDDLQALATAVTATEFLSFNTLVLANEVLTDTWQQDILT